ncbi:hypothetical protein NDU88_000594 [Pleurodeles waltl]|uniref:Uncharacterized protein n=1 Tax=Pleurodeles waltl TaxID=8319 RepID=A0AAV7U5M6_PLEWA|nr:hypothetical protein NDU88_000594 [Pleurodeles waltl]
MARVQRWPRRRDGHGTEMARVQIWPSHSDAWSTETPRVHTVCALRSTGASEFNVEPEQLFGARRICSQRLMANTAGKEAAHKLPEEAA